MKKIILSLFITYNTLSVFCQNPVAFPIIQTEYN